MSKKPIERLYGLPFVLIIALALASYLDLFPVPSWLMALALVVGAVTFILSAYLQKVKKGS